jgi:hypothetical protein
MSDFIVVSADGLKELEAKLKRLPDAVADDGVTAANAYLLNVVKTYPPQNYVTRKAAYGVTFFTARQRRWFFAALRNGEISVPYKRTQGIRNNWRVEGTGRLSFLANDAPGVGWVMGENQSRHEAKVGWKKVTDIIKERTAAIVKAFDGAVKRAIRRVGLS